LVVRLVKFATPPTETGGADRKAASGVDPGTEVRTGACPVPAKRNPGEEHAIAGGGRFKTVPKGHQRGRGLLFLPLIKQSLQVEISRDILVAEQNTVVLREPGEGAVVLQVAFSLSIVCYLGDVALIPGSFKFQHGAVGRSLNNETIGGARIRLRTSRADPRPKTPENGLLVNLGDELKNETESGESAQGAVVSRILFVFLIK